MFNLPLVLIKILMSSYICSDEYSTELGVFHGSDIPSPIQVSTNTAYLQFTSDGSQTRSGFEIQWEPGTVFFINT